MKHDKSPGSDDYTAKFFKFFFVNLGGLMVRSINHGFRKGTISITQRQGIITCIPKKRNNKKINRRPIEFLNTVYKIALSCIARRPHTVLPQLIHEDQKFFLFFFERKMYWGNN